MTKDIIEKCMQSDFKWSTNHLISFANQFNTVMDIGCGVGRILKQICAKKRYGIDACQTVIERARYGNNVCLGDPDFFCFDLKFLGKCWHTRVQLVYGLDIIEHFTKPHALQLLKTIEEIASDMIILFIPVGSHPQTKDDRGFGNDYFQTHRSTWYPEDIDKLGYKVWYYPNWHNQPNKEKGAMWCQKIFKGA